MLQHPDINQYRSYGSIPIGETLSGWIVDMLPLEGKEIGFDPMKVDHDRLVEAVQQPLDSPCFPKDRYQSI